MVMAFTEAGGDIGLPLHFHIELDPTWKLLLTTSLGDASSHACSSKVLYAQRLI
jgi:hypothetical protein